MGLRRAGRTSQRTLHALAFPWSSWLPAAVPDAELVSASRFFRLETGGVPQSRAVQLGQWWPFVLTMILTHGMLPRLLLLGLGSWRLRVATRRRLLDDPEVTALLDRLSAPSVSFERDDVDAPPELAEAVSGPDRIAVDAGTGVIESPRVSRKPGVIHLNTWLAVQHAYDRGQIDRDYFESICHDVNRLVGVPAFARELNRLLESFPIERQREMFKNLPTSE